MRPLSLIFVLYALLPAQLLAADAVTPAPEYQVEMLLFLRDANPSGENWAANASPLDPSLAVATVQGGLPPSAVTNAPLPAPSFAPTPAAPSSLPAPLAPVTGPLVVKLPESSYQLNNHAEALRRKGLTPLLHTAWRQRVGDQDNKDWLWLDAGPVTGLVRISLGRYLHIDTDLAIRSGTGDNATLIRNQDHRRMRSGELHYLDHPAYGILVVINPYQPPEAAATPAPAEAK